MVFLSPGNQEGHYPAQRTTRPMLSNVRRKGLPYYTFTMYTGPNRKLTRLPGYDYRDPGPYAVTICTHHRIHVFGAVDDGVVA